MPSLILFHKAGEEQGKQLLRLKYLKTQRVHMSSVYNIGWPNNRGRYPPQSSAVVPEFSHVWSFARVTSVNSPFCISVRWTFVCFQSTIYDQSFCSRITYHFLSKRKTKTLSYYLAFCWIWPYWKINYLWKHHH